MLRNQALTNFGFLKNVTYIIYMPHLIISKSARVINTSTHWISPHYLSKRENKKIVARNNYREEKTFGNKEGNTSAREKWEKAQQPASNSTALATKQAKLDPTNIGGSDHIHIGLPMTLPNGVSWCITCALFLTAVVPRTASIAPVPNTKRQRNITNNLHFAFEDVSYHCASPRSEIKGAE